MVEKLKSKKPKRRLTKKEAIKKGNRDFRSFTRELAKTMNSSDVRNKKNNS